MLDARKILDDAAKRQELEDVTVTRIGNRTGESKKSNAVSTDVIEAQYRELTNQEKIEFTLLVRQELYNAVPGAIRTLAKVSNDGKPAQAAVAAARQIVLLAEKHKLLDGSTDPLQELSERWAAELEDRREG